MATTGYIDLPVTGGVASLNSLTGAVTLLAGANITITPSGNTLTIAGAASGANTALSNLSATAINASLNPATTMTYALGNSTHTWLSASIDTLMSGGQVVIDVDNEILYDMSARISINWGTRTLSDGLISDRLNWDTTGVKFPGPDIVASTVPYFDASKYIKSSAVTPTELGYVHGVTSSIQAQINAISAPLVFTSNASVGGASSEALTVTGLLATDTILAVTQKVQGSSNLPMLGFNTLANNSLTIRWVADPGPGAIVIVAVKR